MIAKQPKVISNFSGISNVFEIRSDFPIIVYVRNNLKYILCIWKMLDFILYAHVLLRIITGVFKHFKIN